MIQELFCFLGASLAILIPGVCLARVLRLGQNAFECATYGTSLGLALAVYFGSIVSHIDLRLWFPLWILFGIAVLILAMKKRRYVWSDPDRRVLPWMGVLLFLVGVSRFAPALPRLVPAGGLDPTFHSLLAEKIRSTHHAIFDWQPIAPISLNYPTGSHTLVAILSMISRLPVHTVIKDFIPLLGILTTAQIYVLARRLTNSFLPAFYSAIIYGFWAWCGSLDYFRWSGLPNELAMLLFISVLSVWLDPLPQRIAIGCIALLYSAAIVTHHHVMVATGLLILVVLLSSKVTGLSTQKLKTLVISLLLTALLDAYIFYFYLARVGTIRSTGMQINSEPYSPIRQMLGGFGYGIAGLSVIGLFLVLRRKIRCHPLLTISLVSLLVMYVVCEYVPSWIEGSPTGAAITFFTPSRFLADLNYFLAIFAGIVLAYFLEHGWPRSIVWVLLIGAPCFDASRWIDLWRRYDEPQESVDVYAWIRANTSPDTIVDTSDFWATYFSWRRSAVAPIPVSEPISQLVPQKDRIPEFISGEIPPDSPQMKIVAIVPRQNYTGGLVLWHGPGGLLVVQEWPKTQ